MLSKKELIEGIKPLLKEKGYKKRGNTWIKQNADTFTVFNIQTSQYGSEHYYINLGICITGLNSAPTKISDCHFFERIDEKVTADIKDTGFVIKVLDLWNDKFDSVSKLKEKAFEHSLPEFTRTEALEFLLTGIKKDK